MKKLGLFLIIAILMGMLCIPALAFEKVDVTGTGFDSTVIYVAKIQTFLDHGLGTSTTVVAYEEGEPILQVYGTCDSVDGATTAMPVYVKSVFTEAGAVGRAAEFVLDIDVRMGGWANAIKGMLDLSTSGMVTGLGSAICAELIMTGGPVTHGTYTVLELEMVCPANWAGGQVTSFIHAQSSGTTSGNFDDYGYFFTLTGVASDAAHLWYDKGSGITTGDASEWIRVTTPGGVRYLMLYDSPS